MFKKQYKEDFDTIIPDESFMEHLAEKLKQGSPKKRPKVAKHLVACAAIMVVTLSILAGGLTKYFDNNTFIMVAYADDNSKEKVNFDENVTVRLPFGKISRIGESSYIDETGARVYSYDVGFDSGILSVEGENIVAVDYTCEKGEFLHHDSIMLKQMMEEGKTKVIELTAPRETPRERVESNEEVAIKQDNSFLQRGPQVTATYYEELGLKSFNISWTPWHAIDMLAEYKLISFTDLPSDLITVTAHFKNGKITTKQFKFSFDKEGNLITEAASK